MRSPSISKVCADSNSPWMKRSSAHWPLIRASSDREALP